VNWNQKNSCWAELKGQAKRQITMSGNNVNEFAAIGGSRHQHNSLKSIMNNQTKAEKQLSELRDLLEIMGNFKGEVSNIVYEKVTDPDKKLSIPIYGSLNGFDI
jgi:hypothetical protein